MNVTATSQPEHEYLLSLKQNAVEPCLVVNLTTRGAAILQPKMNAMPVSDFNLLIATPSDTDMETIVHAGMRWVDNDYSSRYRKIGIEFSELDASTEKCIQQCINWMLAGDERRIACSVIAG